MEVEQWKKIEGYRYDYMVSNHGRVINNSNNVELKGYKTGKYRNYLTVRLYLGNGTFKNKKIHRLVAENFLENPENLPQVNHKDGNTFNNNYTNLEWCNNSYNQKHAWDNNLNYRTNKALDIKNKLFMSKVKCSSPVARFNENYVYDKSYSRKSLIEGCSESSIDKNINNNGRAITINNKKYNFRMLRDCIKNNKLLVLIGKSGSGKNFIGKTIEKYFNYKKTVCYTNRPIRNGEIDGYDYVFTSKEDIINKANEGYFLNIREYNTKYGLWYYATPFEELLEPNKYCIVDLDGLIDLKNKLGDNIISVYIDCDKETRYERYTNRDNMDKLKLEEAKRRFLDDENKFTLGAIKDNCDLILQNNNSISENEIVRQLKGLINNNLYDINKPIIFTNKIRNGDIKIDERYFSTMKDMCKYYQINPQQIQYKLRKMNINLNSKTLEQKEIIFKQIIKSILKLEV